MPLATLRRLRGRSLAELVERGRQEVTKRLERAGLRDAAEPGPDDLAHHLLPARAGTNTPVEAWLERLRAGDWPRFFASFDDPAATLAALRTLDPDDERRVVAAADRSLEGRFDLLGLRDLDFGRPIDWQLDPVAGRRSPLVHWSRIAYLDPHVSGDHKVVWELNRHQWLVSLGQAYWYTGDERYAEGCTHILTAWMDANPPKRGVNWASSLEVAFRAMSWIWVMRFLQRSPSLEPRVFGRMLTHLRLAGRHLEGFLSTYFSPNTHLTGEALGLYVIGSQLPALLDAERWRALGLDILRRQLPVHVQPDGVYFEQATYYHRYTLDFYLQLVALSERTGAGEQASMGARVVALAEHLASISRPDGSTPLIGDDDGGRLSMLDGRTAYDSRAPLAVAAALFRRGDLAFVAGKPSTELIWLLGPNGIDTWNGLTPAEPNWTSRAFRSGGFYVMRDGWRNDANVMVIDGGAHGAFNCGHAHADALSFDLTVGGSAVFVDPGTYRYTTSIADRDAFRATASHNTVTIDGRSSSEMRGPFHWRHVARSETRQWFSSDEVDYFEGVHDGYQRLDDAVLHERAVVFVKPCTWIVRDTIVAQGEHEVAVTFQCAPGSKVTLGGAREARVHVGDASVLLQVSAPHGSFVVEDGWVSPAYARRVVAPRCRYELRTRGRTTVTTVVGAVVARALALQGAEAWEVGEGEARSIVCFGLEGARYAVAGLETDARCLYVRTDAAGTAAVVHDLGAGRVAGAAEREPSTVVRR
jgi:hypothetical protein